MQLELNYTWIQELLEETKLNFSDYGISIFYRSSFFLNYINEVFCEKLESNEGKEPKWNLDEFLTLCIVFYIEEILSKVKFAENEAEPQISQYKNSYILNLNLPYKNLNKSKRSQYLNLKVEGVKFYYKANKRVLNFCLKQKTIKGSLLTPVEWILLVSSSFFYDSTNKIILTQDSLAIPVKLKELILYRHFKLDVQTARRGVFPVETFSLEEVVDFLKINEDNFLRRCFLDNVGIYCKTKAYKIKKTSPYAYSSALMSYVYYFEGLERLHNDMSYSDSPIKKLWKSDAICIEPGESHLAVPLQPSLAEICQGIEAKNIILEYGQQITRKDLFFLKSDIEALKTKYPSSNKNSEINSPLLKDLELGVKTREKNQKFAQMASKQKTQIAKHRWKESLDCARNIARDKPSHYFATDLARSVAKRKSIPGKLDTLRKKILKDKDIAKYLRQMKEVA